MNRVLDLLKHRVRSLARARGHSVAIILTFTIGLGANTAIFQLIDSVLLRPLRFTDEGQLVSIGIQNHKPGDEDDVGPSWDIFSNDVTAWRAGTQSLTQFAVFSETRRIVAGNAQPDYATGGEASPDLGLVLGVRPLLGRWFAAAERFTHVVVISRQLWSSQFAADSTVLGKRLTIQNDPYTVIGVIDDAGALPLNAKFWIPGAEIGGQVVARLRPGVSLARVADELLRLSPSAANLRRAGYTTSLHVVPLHDRLFGPVRPLLALLSGAGVALLLIACANVASLSLARTLERRRELAIRATLGAGRTVLAAIVISENLLLALVGVVAGLCLGAWTMRVAWSFAPEGVVARSSLGVSEGVALSGTLVACLAALSVSAAPIALMVDGNVARLLSYAGGHTGRGRASRRVRQALAAMQLAMSLVFIISTALLVESIARLSRSDHLGFNASGVTIVTLPLWGPAYRDDASRADILRRFVDRVRALPSTRDVAIGPAPLVGGRGSGLREGFDMIFTYRDPSRADSPSRTFWLKHVDPAYFATYGIHVRSGRALSARDDAQSDPVVVINAKAAKALFGSQNPIGRILPRRISLGSGAKPPRVVGVVDDELQRDVAIDAAPEVFAPVVQRSYSSSNPTIAVRSTDEPNKVLTDLREALRATDPSLAPARMEPMTAILNRSLATHRFLLLALSTFGILAMVIAVIGLYALMAYLVAQREHEMGVRLALGAQRSTVLGMVLSEGGRVVAIGTAIGLPLALGAGRMIASLAYDVRSADLATYLGAALILAAAATVAVYLPARRAANLDPAMTLRAE